MKQHITTHQLKELSRDAFEVYQKSFNLELGDIFVVWDFPNELRVFDGEDIVVTGTVSKLATIGQMIEFLDDHEWWVTLERLNDGWSLFEDPTGDYCGEEPCDLFWKAVKEILNK